MRGKFLAAVVAAFAVLCASATPASAVRYVALGDSYSSGTGTREYYTTCERSVYSYPYRVRNAHPSWTFVFAACGGAKTADVINTQSASLTSGTDWVTYTIGGNDAGFSGVITECAKPWWASNCDGAINTAQSFITNTLPGRLDQVNSKIKSRSPYARVIVLSYPRLFMGVDCNAGTYFTSSEMTRLNTTADMMRDKLREAASRAGTRFVFKDAIPPFVGHAVCSSSEWVNGLSNPTSESYHPNRTGHASGYTPLVRAVLG